MGDVYSVVLQRPHVFSPPVVAVQPDGKYFTIDSSNHGIPKGFDVDVTRFNPNGTIDETFGIGGVSSVDFGSFLDSTICGSEFGSKSSIAGYTLYDRQYSALTAIFTEWSSSRSYTQRVDNLSATLLRATGAMKRICTDRWINYLWP